MKTNSIRLLTIFAIVLLYGASAQAMVERQQLMGQVPDAVAKFNLQPVGFVSPTARLNLAIGLPLRNPKALNALLRQICDPTSPNFRHYLTPEQFTERFGPTEKDYEALVAFAASQGFVVTSRHPNRILLSVTASMADIEKALHVTMRTYQHPTEARTFYAPDVEPSVSTELPILGISGLSDFSRPQPRYHILPAQQQAQPSGGTGPTGGYMGKDFRAAYVPDSSLDGSGQIVGLLQFDGYTASDITYYENLAGLPSITLSNVLIDGASGNPSGGGGEVEVSLDIEMAISMATNLSKVIVYMAPNPSPWEDILNRMANDNEAKQLSCSWYQPGAAAKPTADQIFQQMAAQGQSFFSASGDNDAFTGLIPFPGDTPYITQVGGTTLTTTGPGGSWVSETVWNWGGGIGSGGGISTQYPIPAWQTNVDMTASHGSTTKRNIPDVALTADNVYVRANGRDYNVGGTSCAAPLWAGFTALANQQGAIRGASSLGFVNPTAYAVGVRPKYATSFHDTIVGDNTSGGSPTNFYAVPGYDLCTGWGTPAGTNAINALLAPIVNPLLNITGVTVTGGNGNGAIDPNECDFLYVSIQNYGADTAAVVNATLSTTTPGVTILQSHAPYPDLLPGMTASNTIPFQVTTSPAFVCGAPIMLGLSVTFADGSSTLNYTIPSSSSYGITQTSGASIVPGTTDTGNHCDDCCTTVDLPFAYPFYGQSYSNVTLSSNGNLQFAGSNATPKNVCIPAFGFDQSIVAHWQDLRTDGGSNGIFTSTSGVAPNRIINIEWRAVYYGGGVSTSTVNFEVRLYENQQRFDLIYGDLHGDGSGATVGSQNDTNNYSQFECSSSALANGLQLVFQVPPCPDGGGQCQTGLLGYWTFDEASGNTANDSSGNMNTGAITNTGVNPISWVGGVFGSALYFNNQTQVFVSNSPSLNPFSGITVSAWLNSDHWGAADYNPRILEKGQSNNQYALFSTSSGELEFLLAGVSNGVLIANAPSPGSWHQVAGSFDGSSVKLYIDGQIAAQQPASGVLALTPDNLVIGNKPSGSISNMFGGAIDDVQIYGRALSPSEITQMYNIDTVGDGIPNWWRQQYFGTGPFTNSSSCATCDFDGTGQNNLFKFIAGLDPTNPASAFALDVSVVPTAATVSSGLVAYYPFNGDANDNSGNGNNGTVVNATFQTNGPNGQVTLKFAGNTSSYVVVPRSTSLEPANGLSIAMWCNGVPGQACGNGWGTILRKSGNCEPGYFIRGCNGGTIFDLAGPNVCSGGPRATTAFLPFTGTNWQHIVATYSVSDGMVKTYEDGVLVNQTPFSNLLSHSGNLYIGGAAVAGDDGGFNGSICEVRLYNRALSATEVQQLYGSQSVMIELPNLLFGPVLAGRTYTPQFSTDLVSGTWLPLTFTGPVTNGNQVIITDTNAPVPAKFYRINISQP